MSSTEDKVTLEAVIEIEGPIMYHYEDVEWRKDGPYSVKTGKRVAILSTPRHMRSPKSEAAQKENS